ncbi:hypothetical protein NQ318_000142 [Aromia moschata]|uniref:Uncharacterized protein n=1 Tax=Aromia moschata TaxID=1265417 RepID=A0AAV8XHP0_9CUCU|nr:hypothetical protein NQ318_000142 [Aromia moschata]
MSSNVNEHLRRFVREDATVLQVIRLQTLFETLLSLLSIILHIRENLQVAQNGELKLKKLSETVPKARGITELRKGDATADRFQFRVYWPEVT